jgi:hypothetical protein
MDLFARMLLYAAKWSRRPPSRAWVIAACSAIALAVAVAVIERFVGWPDALTLEPLPRTPMMR